MKEPRYQYNIDRNSLFVDRDKGSVQLCCTRIDFVDTAEVNNVWFIHLPAVNITGYGHTKEEAKHSMEVLLECFYEFVIENDIGVVQRQLSEEGWTDMTGGEYVRSSKDVAEEVEEILDIKTNESIQVYAHDCSFNINDGYKHIK